MAKLQDALDWAARNLPIFPLEYGRKRPTISFPEQATTDPEKIKAMWRDPITGSKDYNIGVLCGDGRIIIDIDTKFDKQFGRSALNNFFKAGGHFNTLVVKTASGGYQAYYYLPPGLEFANGVNILPGVDNRCQNGYGIAPGSFSLESGGEYTLYVEHEIAPIPESLLRLLKPVKSKKDRLNGHSDGNIAINTYTEYLKHTSPAIEGQGGDNHTYNVACMGIVDYGLSVPTVSNLMAEHWNDRCQPPWELDELTQKAENAEAYAIGPAGSKTVDVILNGVEFHAPLIPTAIKTISVEIDHSDTLLPEKQIPVSRWLMHPVLVQGVVTTVVGPGGTGKSAWLIALACNAAVGHQFGPYVFKEAFGTMLYSLEDTRAYVSGRASVICRAYDLDYKEVANHFKVYDQNSETIALVEKTANRKFIIPEQTVRILSEHKNKNPDCKLMIFDPYRKMNRGVDENSNNEQTEAMNLINAIGTSLDVSILLPHHTPKNYMQRKDLDVANPDAASGAGAIVTSSRVVVNLLPQSPADAEKQGKRDDVFSVGVVKNNHGPLGKPSWWERRILIAKNGEQYPAPYPIDIKNAMDKVHQDYIHAIGDYMLSYNINALSVQQAAIIISEAYGHGRSIKTMAEGLRHIFHRGNVVHQYIDTQGIPYSLHLDAEKTPHVFTLLPLPGQPPVPAMILPRMGDDNGTA